MEPSLLTNLLEAQESAWNEQRRVTVEELLSQLGSGFEAGNLVCELVIGEIMLRRRAGDRSDLSSEIRSRFPSLPAYVFEMAARPELASVLPLESTLRGMADTAVEIPVVAGGTQAADAPAVPGYTLLQKIGEGGFGDVWIARNQLDGSPCAVKVLTRHIAAEVGSLQAYQSRGAEHTHLITIRHAGVAQGVYHYVMPLADRLDTPHSPALGDYYIPFSLRHWLSYEGPVPAETVVDLLRQVLLGLQELHRQSLAHCDIKPDNLLRVGGVWKLADIGLASNQSGTGERRGTRAYWPPQVVEPRAADLYALGVTAFVAVTGRRPQEFQPAQSAALAKSLRTSAGRRLSRVIARACHPRPERRYPSAAAMLDDLLATSTIIPVSLAAGVVSLGLLVGWPLLMGDDPAQQDGKAHLDRPLREYPLEQTIEQDRLEETAREVREALRQKNDQEARRRVKEFLAARREVPDDVLREAVIDELLWVMDDPLKTEERKRLLSTWELRPLSPNSLSELKYQRYKLSVRERYAAQIPVHLALSQCELARMLLNLAEIPQDARDAEKLADSARQLLRQRFSGIFPDADTMLVNLAEVRWAEYWRLEAQRRQGTRPIVDQAREECRERLRWWSDRGLNEQHPEYAAWLLLRAELLLDPGDGTEPDPASREQAVVDIQHADVVLTEARDLDIDKGRGQLASDFNFLFQKMEQLRLQWIP
jgi:serine/threonine protein kinase